MIARVIDFCAHNRFLVVLITVLVTAWAIYASYNLPVDAIPDLSDVQVIIKTDFPGQAPQVVEDQVTFPLTTAMLAVPRAKVVRGYSMFAESLVYVIFEDGTDIYWARSRVLEYLNFVSNKLPKDVMATLGPDATGVGWVFQYTVEDPTGKHNLAQLRSIQDWYLRYQLQTVPGVAEVAVWGALSRPIRWWWTPTPWPPTASPCPGSKRPSCAPTTTWGARSSNRPGPNTWSGAWAISKIARMFRISWWGRTRRALPS